MLSLWMQEAKVLLMKLRSALIEESRARRSPGARKGEDNGHHEQSVEAAFQKSTGQGE